MVFLTTARASFSPSVACVHPPAAAAAYGFFSMFIIDFLQNFIRSPVYLAWIKSQLHELHKNFFFFFEKKGVASNTAQVSSLLDTTLTPMVLGDFFFFCSVLLLFFYLILFHVWINLPRFTKIMQEKKNQSTCDDFKLIKRVCLLLF